MLAKEHIENIFRWILQEAAKAKFINSDAIFVDGTHIKANANLKKSSKRIVK